jgi:hypothetical protein
MSSETDRTIEAGSVRDAGEIPASDVLYQDVPEQSPGLRLEDMETKLKTTTSPILQKFLRTQIERLKRDKGEIGLPSRHPVMPMPGQKVEAKLDAAKRAERPELPNGKPRRWEPPNRPLTLEDLRIRRAVNAAADAVEAAEGTGTAKTPSQEIAMTAVEVGEMATATPEGIDEESAQVNSANSERTIVRSSSMQSDKSDRERAATKMKWALTIGFLAWVLWQVANGVFMWGIRLRWWGHTPGTWKF